jgi:hypothetical protein
LVTELEAVSAELVEQAEGLAVAASSAVTAMTAYNNWR